MSADEKQPEASRDAEKKKTWRPPSMDVTGKLGLVKFNPDEQSHLRVIDPEVCRRQCPPKYCTHTCPAQVYRWEEEEELISIAFEGCLECGTCRTGGCPFDNIEMRYPRGGFGVQYRFG
jgi:ferredoxin like protein